jgi:transposase-like protein
MMAERGLTVDHSTIYRWVMHYAPQLEKRCRLHLQQTNDSWRVDETYVRVKGKWKGSVAKNGMGFKSFNTARQTLREIEAMSMIRQGQVNRINQGDNISQVKFIEELFGAIASGNANDIDCLSLKSIYDTTSISSKVGIRA